MFPFKNHYFSKLLSLASVVWTVIHVLRLFNGILRYGMCTHSCTWILFFVFSELNADLLFKSSYIKTGCDSILKSSGLPVCIIICHCHRLGHKQFKKRNRKARKINETTLLSYSLL